MFAYIWPVGLIILSNVFYHICTKSSPEGMDPFAVLTVTYIVGALVSTVMYFVLNRGGNLLKECAHINWAPFVLGIVIVGLEVGNIYAYKAGWPISIASTIENVFLAIALLFVGYLVFGEALSMNKVVGMLICLVGLWFINK